MDRRGLVALVVAAVTPEALNAAWNAGRQAAASGRSTHTANGSFACPYDRVTEAALVAAWLEGFESMRGQ